MGAYYSAKEIGGVLQCQCTEDIWAGTSDTGGMG